MNIPSLKGKVGLFFLADGKLLLHTCPLADAQPYSDFLNYPYSHDAIWRKHYQHTYHVDFDYWPRGRIIYCTATRTYSLFYDVCMVDAAKEMVKAFGDEKVQMMRDEHYQCHTCNDDYAWID